MRWLAIDTSGGTTVGVVETAEDPQTGAVTPSALAERVSADARGHVESLTPMIAAVLAEVGLAATELDAVAVGTGPAPFTGLRVGIATAAAFARGAGLPAHGVCSLDAVARGHQQDVVVVADARRRELYWAAYRGDATPGRDGWRAHGPAVGPPSDVEAWITAHGGIPVGPGIAAAPQLGGEPGDVVTPADLVALAETARLAGEPTPLTPRYLRRPDIHPAAGRKRAS